MKGLAGERTPSSDAKANTHLSQSARGNPQSVFSSEQASRDAFPTPRQTPCQTRGAVPRLPWLHSGVERRLWRSKPLQGNDAPQQRRQHQRQDANKHQRRCHSLCSFCCPRAHFPVSGWNLPILVILCVVSVVRELISGSLAGIR